MFEGVFRQLAVKGGRFFAERAARHQDGLFVIQFGEGVDDMQAVGHHGNVIEAAEHRHHLQHRAAGVKNDRVAIVNEADRGFGNPLFFMGVDQRFVVDGRIGLVFI